MKRKSFITIKKKRIALAKKTINTLFKFLNKKITNKQKNRYIEIIRSIASKFRIKLTNSQKMKFCRKCNSYIDPQTSKHRINKKLTIVCENCGNVKRIHLNR